MKINKIDIGWVKFHRKIRKWKYYNKLKYEKIWSMLLMEANFSTQDLDGFIIGRGELIFSYDAYTEKLKNSEPKISRQNIRTIIKNLQKDKQIEVKYVESRRFTLIKIIKYDEYQRDESIEESEKIAKLEKENARLRAALSVFDAQKTNMETQGKLTWLDPKSNMVNDQNQHGSKALDTDKQESLKEGFEKPTRSSQKSNMVSSEINTETQGELTCLEESNKENLKNTYKQTRDKTKKSKEKDLEKREKEKEQTFSIVTQTVSYLNKKGNFNLRVTEGGGHYKIISKRIKENYTLEDFKQVIDFMVDRWLGTKWQTGLTTKKLFGDDFDSYLDQAKLRYKQNENNTFASFELSIDEETLKKEQDAFNRMMKETQELDNQLAEIRKSKRTVIPFEENTEW
jgi:uncharacterized phage protein (TIGR02220 family)